MRRNIKPFVAGVLVTLLLMSFVVAAPLTKSISVLYNNIKVYVDDNAVTLKDPTGKVVEPFVYNGTTYVPLRGVSEALGKPVQWDGKTSSIYIGKRTGSSIDLTSLDYARASGYKYFDTWKDSASFSLVGQEYRKGIGYVVGYEKETSYVVYNLNSMYKTLSGYFGTDDTEKDNPDLYTQMTIIGDGNELYNSEKAIAGNQPKLVNVDVTGVNQIEIHFTANSGWSYQGHAVFANPKLTQ